MHFRNNKNKVPYTLDINKPVYVYRNLHKKCWSIRQNNIVIAHCTEIVLYNAITKVSVSGRNKVLKERKKNVHAFIVGYVYSDVDMAFNKELYYNPYAVSNFVDRVTNDPVLKAEYVLLASDMKVRYK